MIFVTVGTQLSFDRMVRAVDQWAGKGGQHEIFAQIGPAKYQPSHMRWKQFIDATEFRSRVSEAELVIAHAGMGSIITALELGRPILVMPRRAALGEHRNDHQVATAERFLAQGRIQVAFDEAALATRLDHLEEVVRPKGVGLSTVASPELIHALRAFVNKVPDP